MSQVTAFINEVKMRESLWNPTDKNYFNKRDSEAHWKVIAARFGLSIRAAKRKWKNLRDTYRVEVKKLARLTIEEPDKVPVSLWSHYQTMSFLRKYLKSRKPFDRLEDDEGEDNFTLVNVGSITKNDDHVTNQNNTTTESVKTEQADIELSSIFLNSDDCSEDDNHENVSKTKRRKMSHDEDNVMDSIDEKDDDLLFFRSLLPFVKQLNPSKRLMYRMKVQEVLHELLYSEKSN